MNPGWWAAAGALGALGAVGRVLLDGAVSRRVAGRLPAGTLAVNLLGALALGLLTGLGVGGGTRFALAGGFVGAFTTFSTWMFETQRLVEDGRTRPAGVNLAVSVAGGLGAIGLGWWIGSVL